MRNAEEWARYAQERGIVGCAEREYLSSMIRAVQREIIDAAARICEENGYGPGGSAAADVIAKRIRQLTDYPSSESSSSSSSTVPAASAASRKRPT